MAVPSRCGEGGDRIFRSTIAARDPLLDPPPFRGRKGKAARTSSPWKGEDRWGSADSRLLLRNSRRFAHGIPALVFARHEGAELRRRRAFDHDADRDQELAHLVVGDDVDEGLVQLGDDRRRNAGRTEYAVPRG